jgi:transcriptional regulator with XRE-family HTH domain
LSRLSDPLLKWLRTLLQERKLNAAALAEMANIPRARARHVLTGQEAMTVEELLQISKALDLSPADFGLGAAEEEQAEGAEPGTPEEEAPAEKPAPVAVTGTVTLDPYGNQVRQLFEVGFGLAVDFLFIARTDALEASGVPRTVLDAHAGRDLLIKLDAAYHPHNNPRYDDGGITLTLSFDALYDCRFPWSAIHRLMFFPAPAPSPAEVEEEPPEEKPKRPHLRLVE